jgi:predicted membrane protein
MRAAAHPAHRFRRPAPTTAPQRVLDLSRLLLGLVVVALGVVFLLDSAGVLDAERAIDRWWPVVIVAAGILTLAERPPSIARGWLLIGAGGLLLLFTTTTLDNDAWAYVWPAVIVLVGLTILARWGGRATIAGTAAADEVVRSTAIFGGPKLASTAQQFRGAWLTAVFGGVTLDLRHARPAPEGASINATVAFGGIDVLVPRGWRISVRSTPIFGGVEDKTDRSEPPADDAPVLRVDAVCLFGGVDIKHGR